MRQVLGQMGFRWVCWRAWYEGLKKVGLYRWHFRPYADTTRDPVAVYRAFRSRLLPRLDRDRVLAFYAQYPELREALLARAERVAAGQVEAYGTPVDLSQHSFTLDPQSGQQWPVGEHGSTYRIYRPGFGDVKYAWELNNFHFAPALAQAAVLTDDRRYYGAFTGLVEKWIADNPGQVTVNWSSNLETGVRLYFWCLTWELFQHAPSFPQWAAGDTGEGSFFLRFSRSLHAQVRYMLRHLGLSARCYQMNHVLGDLVFLVYPLSCYPDLPEAARVPALERAFERELARQFLSDGTYEMASLNYQRYVTEYLLVYLQARTGMPPARRARLMEVARGSVRYLAAFCDGAGESLRFGENDGAYLSRLGSGAPDDFGAFFLWAQTVTGEVAGKDYSAGAREAAAWLGVDDPASGPSPSLPAELSFPAGGYWRYADPRLGLWVRTGRRPAHAAGQADLLSFSLSLDGTPLVVQPGTGLYNGTMEMRNYFRSALSHSVLQVDGGEPMRTWGRFRYLEPAQGWGGVVARGDDWVLFVGRHDGFDRLGVTVRRAFLVRREQGVAVIDCVSGRGTHTITRGLHLAEPLDPRVARAGLEGFQPVTGPPANFGRAHSYGQIMGNCLLQEGRARDLPWVGAYYLGVTGEARVEHEGDSIGLWLDGERWQVRGGGAVPTLTTPGGQTHSLDSAP
jgi:hypothetical protein